MLEPAVIVLRLIQYGAAMILCGSSLFLINALPASGPASGAVQGWPRRALAWSAGLAAVAALLGLLAQTCVLAGSVAVGMTFDSLSAVMTSMALGPSSLVRGVVALAALMMIAILKPGRRLWFVCAVLGAVACGSFAWMGHGAASHGPAGWLHTAADIAHLLAAAVWIGALAMFLGLLVSPSARADSGRDEVLHRALAGFSGLGSAVVAVLLLSGLVNSWFLVGPSRLSGLWSTPYGVLLVLKVLLFGAMLIFAALNRYRLTPALAQALQGDGDCEGALTALRRSLILETVAGLAILGLVAWLGTLAPIAEV